MTAKQQSIKDIKASLKAQGKCFITFRRELNSVMRKLVRNYIKDQELCKQ